MLMIMKIKKMKMNTEALLALDADIAKTRNSTWTASAGHRTLPKFATFL